MFTPPYSFSHSLSHSQPHTALSYLQSLDLLIPPQTPPTSHHSLQSALTTLHTTHTSLLHLILPLLLLPASTSHQHSPINPLISTLLSRLHLLPPHLHSHQQQQQQHHPLAAIPPPLRDDLNTSLAQSACTQAHDLLHIWNSISPPSFHATHPSNLSDQIHALRSRLLHMRSTTIQHIDPAIRDTRTAALNVYASAMRATIGATERDLEERVTQPSADDSHVDMLAARAHATTAKLRLQRAEIAAMVYTEEAVRALGRVAREVARRRDDVAHRLQVGERQLGEYRKLGAEFEGVVEEYHGLKAVLEEKMWARDQLVGVDKRQERF